MFLNQSNRNGKSIVFFLYAEYIIEKLFISEIGVMCGQYYFFPITYDFE